MELGPEPVYSNSCSPVKQSPDALERDPHTMTCDPRGVDALVFRDSFLTA